MTGGAARDGRPVLVTGGAGFIGCNFVDRLCRDGHRVVVYDSLARPGVETNLSWLRSNHGARIAVEIADLRDAARLADAAASASAVFHFAAQVAVTTSLVEPAEDFAVNVVGTVNLLEALRRRNPDAPLVFASTNKVYGNLGGVDLVHERDTYVPVDRALRQNGVAETIGLAFHTPYGCSKGAADQYVLDYAGSFGLRAAAFRMSCIYGPHQMGTEDQGWVAHFIRNALAGEPITIFGDGHQVRDVLHVEDAIDAYIAAWKSIDAISGQAFNLGGGTGNAISLVQLLDFLREDIGELDVAFREWRPGDQRYYVSDRRRADVSLRLAAPRPWRQGVAELIDWMRQHRPSAPTSRVAVTADQVA